MRKALRLIMTLSIVPFFVSGLLLGCGGQEEPQQAEPQSVTEADVKEEAMEAVAAVGAYTEAKKEEYQKMLNDQLQKYGQKIDALRTQGAMMTQDAKHQLTDQLEALKEKKDALQQKAEELESKTGQAWEDAKAGVDRAKEDLEMAFKDAASHFGSSQP